MESGDKVINTIKSGGAKMRPRAYFIVRSALAIIGAVAVFFVVLFLTTFIIFALQENGGIFATNFGPGGWEIFFESLPWTILALSIALLLILWVLLRRYAIVYHQPLLYTLLILVVVVSITAIFLLPGTSLQGGIFHYVSKSYIPVVTGVYEFDTAPMSGVYRGQVLVLATSSFILVNGRGQTSTVLLVPMASPEIGGLSPGDYVLIFGRGVATATIQASGVEKIVDYQ